MEAFYKKFSQKQQKNGLERLLTQKKEWFLDFSSNDYLGLKKHPVLIQAAQGYAEKYGVGAGASRLISGNMDIHENLEQLIAHSKKQESALIFASGYQANVSVLTALLDKVILKDKPLVFSDKLNHASIHAGCQLAGVRQIRYRHLDLNHLDYCLTQFKTSNAPKFVLTESVFGMDGDFVDLIALRDLCSKHNAFLYVDEAHATGVFGKNGYGLCSDVEGIHLAMGTFSKALGGFGGYVATSREVKRYLMNRCGGFIYTTAVPPPMIGAMTAAWNLLPSLQKERLNLLEKASDLRCWIQKKGGCVGNSQSQIVPVIVGDATKTMKISENLKKKGVFVPSIRPPTVPPNTSRLRISLTAHHTNEDIDFLKNNISLINGHL